VIKRDERIHGSYVRTLQDVIRFAIQAYADDVVFISESSNGIVQMLQILEYFAEWSRMEVNVEKCAIASYVYDEDRRRIFLDRCFTLREQEIPNMTTADSMRYLEAPISARRIIKFKTARFKLKEIEILLGKIMSSPLLAMQKIDTIKIILLPSLDFLLLNGEIGVKDLEVMDKKIRGMINRDLNIKGLPVECHHASWRDGEMERWRDGKMERWRLVLSEPKRSKDVLTIRSFVQMTLSRDDKIRDVMRQLLKMKRNSRGLNQIRMQHSSIGEREEIQEKEHQRSLPGRKGHIKT
jgi:hypothetical protein